MRLSGESALPPRKASIPRGTHAAVLVGCAELGTQDTGFPDKNGKPKFSNKVRLIWQVPAFPVTFTDRRTNSERTEPAIATMNCTASMGTEKMRSNLRKVYEAMMGVTVEADGEYELGDMVGRGCLLQISHRESDNGSVWESVENVVSLPDGMPVPRPVGPTVNYVIRDADGNRNEPPERFLSAKMIEQIRHSPEYTGIGTREDDVAEAPNVDDTPF